MRILIEAHHPAHIHFFKHAVRAWRERGHEVLMLGRDRDVMRALLAAYDWIPSRLVSVAGKNNRFPLAEFVQRQLRVASTIASFRADIVLSLMGSYTQSTALFGRPNIIFTDSEFQSFNHRIAHPFATRIYTPECFWKDLGPRQVRYRGYHELAFLHPRRFQPDPGVLDELGLARGSYLVLRTSAWNTLHDVGERGIEAQLDAFVERALGFGPVVIVPEGGRLPARWEHLRLRVAPHRFHDVLAFAKLVATEGASTASEAACLGVPAVYVNTTRRGYLDDQAHRYGLVYDFREPQSALDRTLSLLREPPDPQGLAAARRRLIDEHVDVTQLVVELVEQFDRDAELHARR